MACCFNLIVVLRLLASSRSFLDFLNVVVVVFCLVFGTVGTGDCDMVYSER